MQIVLSLEFVGIQGCIVWNCQVSSQAGEYWLVTYQIKCSGVEFRPLSETSLLFILGSRAAEAAFKGRAACCALRVHSWLQETLGARGAWKALTVFCSQHGEKLGCICQDYLKIKEVCPWIIQISVDTNSNPIFGPFHVVFTLYCAIQKLWKYILLQLNLVFTVFWWKAEEETWSPRAFYTMTSKHVSFWSQHSKPRPQSSKITHWH